MQEPFFSVYILFKPNLLYDILCLSYIGFKEFKKSVATDLLKASAGINVSWGWGGGPWHSSAQVLLSMYKMVT